MITLFRIITLIKKKLVELIPPTFNKLSKLFVFFFLFHISLNSNSQNYVKDGSLELKDSCSCNIGWILNNQFWYSMFTSEYFYSCACASHKWPNCGPMIGCSPYKAYQKPRTGDAFFGHVQLVFYHYPQTITRNTDYSSVNLTSQLDSGEQYIVKFYTSLSRISKAGTDNIQIALTSDSLYTPLYPNIPTTPFLIDFPDDSLIYNHIGKGCILDTSAWVQLTDTFIARGTEKVLTIGGFSHDSLISWQYLWPGSMCMPCSGECYYFFDDISIYKLDTIPPVSNTGNDTTICIGGKAILGKHSCQDYYYEWFTKDTAAINSANIWNKYNNTDLLKYGYLHYEDQLNLIDSTGIIEVKPTQTTTYYCLATDFTYTKTLDSVTVYVIDCGHANDTTVCVEQAFTLGTQSLPQYNYKWSPPTYLNTDTIGQPLCSPMSDITYSLLITNSNNDTVSLDTVNIYVVNCYSAEAGLDTTICLGDSIQIGTHNHSSCTYVWWPNQWLSDSTIGMPFTKPDTLIKYFLQVIDTLGNISVDSIVIGVVNCDTVGVNQLVINNQELVIYPNPASGYMIVEFNEFQHQDCKFELYDNIGRKVLERVLKKGESKYQLSTGKLESGVYFYKLEAGESYKGKIIISK
ncbi:MAG: T9SS type A sorting domain-containing protein [Saprospiraceae bacterium]|nr:T9SS type A sorting domain-containing protein [Saprospiraceae bacterium]